MKATEEQIRNGRLANGELDPRGYVVTCSHPRCVRQWWGTPDNLPITHAECDKSDCPNQGEAS